MLTFDAIKSLFLLFLSIEAAQIIDRIANDRQLLHCQWFSKGANSSTEKEFSCSSKSNHVKFSLMNTTSSKVPLFGSDHLKARSSSLNVNYETKLKNTKETYITCLFLEYCLSGTGAHLTLSAQFMSGTENITYLTKQMLWSRQQQIANETTQQPTECRQLLQTVYDKTIFESHHEAVNLTLKAELTGVPSSFHFEEVALFSGACTVRIEAEYYRQYESHLTANIHNFEPDDDHNDIYFHYNDDRLLQDVAWTRGQVPFSIHIDGLTETNKAMLLSIFETIQNETCLKFNEIQRSSSSYLRITDEYGDRCFTEEMGFGDFNHHVILNIGTSCWQFKTIARHVMHALGFADETNRPDRDLYVTIKNPDEINFDKHDFELRLVETWNLPFDFKSVTNHLEESTTFSELDIRKIRSLLCPQAYKCVVDQCPSDSHCRDELKGCQCVSDKSGHPGSCLALMDNYHDKNCGPMSIASYGKLLEVGDSGVALCACSYGSFTSGSCYRNESTEEKIDHDFSNFSNILPNCPFGYRQLPSSNFRSFTCKPAPVAVFLTLTAHALLVPTKLDIDQSITTLNGLDFVFVPRWSQDFANPQSFAYLSASKAVRFEVLRALSLIYFGDDTLITKKSAFNLDFTSQEPWINPFGSVRFSQSVFGSFSIDVVIYFTQPVYHDLTWLHSRLLHIFGMDAAERDNGFVFIHAKRSLTLDDEPCRMFLRPACPTGQICHQSFSSGEMTVCSSPSERFQTSPSQVLPPEHLFPSDEDDLLPPTDGSDDGYFGLSTLEIALIGVAAALAIIIVVGSFFALSSNRKRGSTSRPAPADDGNFEDQFEIHSIHQQHPSNPSNYYVPASSPVSQLQQPNNNNASIITINSGDAAIIAVQPQSPEMSTCQVTSPSQTAASSPSASPAPKKDFDNEAYETDAYEAVAF